MPQYTLPKQGHASEMMWDSCLGGASPYVHCSCGVEHSLPCDEAGNYHSEDMFEYSNLDGQVFVYECDGCKTKLAKYERFIWENRDNIRRYLKTRIDQEKAWADQEHLLNTLANI
jgi:hypothetical protein